MKNSLKAVVIILLSIIGIGTTNPVDAQVFYRLVDAGDMPVSLDTDQGLMITLSRPDSNGMFSQVIAACSFQPVGSTWPNEGCPSVYGDGTIVAEHIYDSQTGTYTSAPLNSGRYDLAVSASGKLLARKSFNYVAGNFLALDTIRLQHSPVRVTLVTPHMQNMSSAGGTFRMSVNLEHNLEYAAEEGITVLVNGTISGPAVTAHHQQYGLSPEKFHIMPGESQTFTSPEITVPAEIPNGSPYCVNVYISKPERQGVVFSNVSACVIKGGRVSWLPAAQN